MQAPPFLDTESLLVAVYILHHQVFHLEMWWSHQLNEEINHPLLTRPLRATVTLVLLLGRVSHHDESDKCIG